MLGRRKSKSDVSESSEESLSKKDLALQQALDHITASFGKGAIMWLGRSHTRREVPVVSTGSFSLDLALGIGGLPKGRVVEIYGPEASGKTTLALHVIAEAQKAGDAEHALDPSLAETIGVKTDNLLLSQPDCGEQALSLVDTLIRSGSVDVVVVDSVAALVPKSELDGEMGDAHMALQARLMSQALRKLSHSLSLSQTILIFINQVLFIKLVSYIIEMVMLKITYNPRKQPCRTWMKPRIQKLPVLGLYFSVTGKGDPFVSIVVNQACITPYKGVVYFLGIDILPISRFESLNGTNANDIVRSKLSTFGGFGGPTEVTSGGNALKFYASVRLNIKRIGLVKKGEETVGSQVLVKIVKNKHAPPFKTVQFELEFGKGISRDSELIELGCKHKFITKGGVAFYSLNGHSFRGKDAIKRYFAENEGAREELMMKLKEKLLQETEKKHEPESQVPDGDLMEEIVTSDTTDEEVVTAVEA
ncbi:hypothetical protein COCNU_09G001050 [Cocos nucifera]|uniref:Uncharacterized protein n=1 Tax=Cocos nucifera TaxID=13894 RepID=A0A8K0IJ29_COCNU|nr:hypothetical protein COCNU_09G001050 [Cocos nucifera]